MIGMKRDVIYDTDGSLSQTFDGNTRSSAAIVQSYKHIATYYQNVCPASTTPSAWDNCLMCNSNVTVRRVAFTNPVNSRLFKAQAIKVMPIIDIKQTIDPNISSNFYTEAVTHLPGNLMEPKKQKPLTWSLPFITGEMYNIWWGTGIDFSHLSIFTTPLYTPEDKGIIFKFNYSQNREKFNVGPMRGGVKLTSYNYTS